MNLFRRKRHYFTLYFKGPKTAETHRVTAFFRSDRMGQNRIANLRAGEGLTAEHELVGLIRHGKMTAKQWEQEL